MSVVDVKTNVFIDANQAFLRFYGLSSKAELLGRQPHEFAPEEISRQIYELLLRDGRITSREFDFPGSDGKLLSMLLSISTMELGGRSCYVTTAHDITAIREAERKLRENEATMRTIFEACPDGISVIGLDDSTFRAVNDS